MVVALDCEAKPLISALAMKRRKEHSLWSVYSSRDESRWLVVSGVGVVASSAATAFLAAIAMPTRYCCWMNVGIAGHPSLELGTLCRAVKISTSNGKKVWYPAEVTGDAPRGEVLQTCGEPRRDFPGGGLVEMEAAGFYETAARMASRERVQVLKVVSDNADNDFEKSITRERVVEWMTRSVDRIVGYAERLCELDRKSRDRERERSVLWEGVEVHVTVTQRFQVERLLERLQVLGNFTGEDWLALCAEHSAGRDLVAALEERAAACELNW